MLVGNLTIHQGVQSLRGTVTVDLWTFLFFSILTKVVFVTKQFILPNEDCTITEKNKYYYYYYYYYY